MVNGVPREVPRLSIHHDTLKDFPYNVIFSASRTSKEEFFLANGLPREYHGHYIILNNGILKSNTSIFPHSEGYITQYTP